MASLMLQPWSFTASHSALLQVRNAVLRDAHHHDSLSSKAPAKSQTSYAITCTLLHHMFVIGPVASISSLKHAYALKADC